MEEKITNKTHTKKIIAAVIIFGMIAVLAIVGVVFAYYVQSKLSGYGTDIKATNIAFKFNDRTYLDEIGSADLDLYKGGMTDVDMEVKVIGTNRAVVNYSVSFALDYTGSDAEMFATAVEVYKLDTSTGREKYEFLCMADKLADCVIADVMITDYTETVPLRFVFSPSAGDYYDNLVLSGDTRFTIKASASAVTAAETAQYVFATTKEEFAAAFKSENTVGKTIILAGEEDEVIAVDEAMTSAGTVGIELNGRTLKLNQKLTVNADTSSGRLGLTNRKASGGIDTANANFVVQNAVKIYYIDNRILPLSETLDSSNVKMLLTDTNRGAVFDDYIALLKERTQKLSDGTVYYSGDDVTFIFSNLFAYNKAFNLISVAPAVQYNQSTGAAAISIANELTTRYQYSLSASHTTSGTTKIDSVAGNVTVRGNSAYAIAENLKNQMPSTIQGGVFLDTYDRATGAHISWQVDDGLGGELLNSDGGINFFDRNAVIVSAEERTAYIYNNIPVTITQDEVYDIYGDFLVDEYKTKMGLTAIDFVVANDPDDDYENNDFLVVVPRADGSPYKMLKVVDETVRVLPQNELVDVDFDIVFTYGDKTYRTHKEMQLSGQEAYVTKYDMTFTLQQPFSDNEYIEGTQDYFYAHGALLPQVRGKSVPVLVEYTPLAEAASYLAISYEFSPMEYDDLSTQFAYFIKNGDTYEFIADTSDTNKTYYERRAVVRVIRSKIPAVDSTTANVSARLYTLNYDDETATHTDAFGNKVKGTIDLDADGNKVYKDPESGDERELIYYVTLAIEGIIQHSAEQVVDGNLYYILRQIFDLNGDGNISTVEARDPQAIINNNGGYLKSFTSENSGTIYYLDLAWMSISSLKGLEYFTIIDGFDLSSTGRSDLSVFSQFHNLVYLDLSNNLITDLSALKYLDKLEYLDVSTNSVTSVEPLRYIQSLKTLYLDNNMITDFSALTNIATLKTLSLMGMKTSVGASFLADPAAMYAFALVSANNPSVNFLYDEDIVIDAPMRVAAKVMRDLEDINRVTSTLYLPTFYYYLNENGVVQDYQLYWYVDPMYDDLIRLTYENGSPFVKYSISSPIQDKPVKIYVKVYTGVGTESYFFSRTFNITLGKGSVADTYIFDGKNNTYILAAEAIPDLRLRTLIFEQFNRYTTGNVAGFTYNGTSMTMSEEYVISAADFMYYQENTPGLFNWSYQNINSLEGIGYFSDLLLTDLNLTGNTFASSELEYLQDLKSLVSLTLGGELYDFNDLAGGLDALQALYVYECYGLETDEVLNALYQVYCEVKTADIYITRDAVWNPYATLMAKEVRNLPGVISLDRFQVYYNIYKGQYGSVTSTDGFAITLYGTDYTFRVSAATIYGGAVKYNWNTTYGLRYNTISGNDQANTFKGNLQSTAVDPRGDKISYADYYIQLLATDISYRFYVHNTSGDGEFEVKLLKEVIASPRVRQYVLGSIYPAINSASYSTAVTGTFANDEAITVALNNSENDATKRPYAYYLDPVTDCYHITTKFLGRYSSASLTLYGESDANRTEFEGLKYCTGITGITTSQRTVELGDGSDLINLMTLTINYSVVDLTTISVTLPKLKTLSISNYFVLNIGTDANSPFVYMPNLESLTIITVRSVYSSPARTYRYYGDLSTLNGLIDNDGNSKLKTLTAHSFTNGTSTPLLSAAAANNVYSAAEKYYGSDDGFAYKIGSPEKDTDTAGFFRVIDGESWYCTANTDETKSLSWDSTDETGLSISELEAYDLVNEYMPDMGLKVNSSYWAIGSRVHELTAADKIYLPSNTAQHYYGHHYDTAASPAVPATAATNYYGISWKVYIMKNGTETMLSYAPSTASLMTELNLSSSTYRNCTLFIVGTFASAGSVVGKGALPEGAVAYSYIYQFVVTDTSTSTRGDGYYSAVIDKTLRLVMFSIRETVTDTIFITTSYDSSKYGVVASAQVYKNLELESLEAKSASAMHKRGEYIYSLAGIDTLVASWGKINSITTIRIGGQRFTDLSPLFSFTKLQNLSLRGSDSSVSQVTGNYYEGSRIYQSAARFTSTRNDIWRELVSANFSGCVNFGPSDLANFARTERLNLANLSLKMTRCESNIETAQHLLTIIGKTTAKSIKFTMYTGTSSDLNINNASTDGSQTITYAECYAYVTNITSAVLYPSGLNSSANIMATGTESRTVASSQFTFSMYDNVNQMLKNRNISNVITVKIIANSTKAAYLPFTNCYISVDYRRNDITSPYTFGTGSRDISDFDTEMIAYLLYGNYLTLDGYNYTLNKDCPITYNTNTGISSTRNLSTLSSTKNITFGTAVSDNTYTLDNYWMLYWAYGDISSTFSSTERVVNVTEANILSHAVNYNVYFYNKIISTYAYIGGAQFTYKATLPTHIYALGKLYEIRFDIPAANNTIPGTPKTTAGDYFTKTSEGWIFTLDAGNTRPDQTTSGASWKMIIYADLWEVSPSTGASRSARSYGKTITVKKSSEAVPEVRHNFFLEVDVVGTDVVILDETSNVKYTIGQKSEMTVHNFEYVSAAEYRLGSGARTAIDATEIFDHNLAAFIFADHCYTQVIKRIVGADEWAQEGYLMTTAQVQNMTAIEVYYSGKTGTTGLTGSTYISSLEGVQIFYNAQSLIVRGQSHITDLSPIANLHLTTFYVSVYTNSSHYYMYDFTPLMQGSRDTLEDFWFDNTGYANMLDYNFLLGFTNLKRVFLGTHTVSSTVTISGLAYFQTSHGQYVLNSLYSRGTYIYTRVEAATRAGLTCDMRDEKKIGKGNPLNLESNAANNGLDLYPINGSGDHLVAERVLSGFDPILAGESLVDGYKLHIDQSVRTTSGLTTSFKLATHISQSNTFYFVEWISGSPLVTVNGYTLASDITVDGTTYSAGQTLTTAQAKTIVESMIYYQMYSAGLNSLTINVSVNSSSYAGFSDIPNAKILCRTYMSGYGYDRLLTLSF